MKNFLIVDFEFTMYTKPVGRPNGFFSEIIEVGAVKLSGEAFNCTGKLQNFVKPHFIPSRLKKQWIFA